MEQVKKQQGVTLLELLITVAIIGILSSIALPNYSSVINQSHRKAAQLAMLDVHMQQQRYYLLNRKYAEASKLDFPHNKHYEIVLSDLSGSAFTLTATAKTANAKSFECAKLTLDHYLAKKPTSCW